MPNRLAALLRSERDASDQIAVPRNPRPHPLVQSWLKPQKPSYGVPWFTVAGESRRRRIASVLFREVERRGGTVAPSRENEHDTHRFSIGLCDETIEVSFQERLTKVIVPPDPKVSYSYETAEWHPTELLRLRFENYLDVPIRREWNDTGTKRIEGQLREILVALYFAVEAQRLRTERLRREQALRAEAERQRWERAERERCEREAVQELLGQAKAWEDARRIRSYVDAMKERAGKEPRWAEWALDVADRLDPAKAEDEKDYGSRG